MGSKIVFLGTAGGSEAVSRQLRGSGGIIVQVDSQQLHIDPGPGSLLRAIQYGIDLRQNTGLLVSHSHINHCNDANAIVGRATGNGKNKTLSMVSPDDSFLTKFHAACLKNNFLLEPGKAVKLGTVEIRALGANHSTKTIGFKLFTPKFILSYSADTAYSKELIKAYSNSSILILNLLQEKKSKHNLGIEDAVKIIAKVKPKLTIIQHFSKELIDKKPLQIAREIQNKTKCQVIAARDGMVIDPFSYSATMAQKTLNVY